MLATDIYKQVIGQQNFEMGAVVGFVLLIPAVLAFAADRITQRRQVALLSARAVPFEPKPQGRRDWLLFAFCAVVGSLILGILAMAAWASFVTCWPYNLVADAEATTPSATSTPTAGARTGIRSSWPPGRP